MIVRKLDFCKMEDEYVFEFNATKIQIPKELYGGGKCFKRIKLATE